MMLASVEALLEQAEGQVAAVIVEAVGANMGVVPPKQGFLEAASRVFVIEHELSADF